MPENNITKKAEEISSDGSFKRQKNRFTTPFGNNPGDLPVEANRYRLLWTPACPWAHRTVIVRNLLGLDKVISLGTASPLRPKTPQVDWEFSLDENGIDPVLHIRYMSEIYKKTDPTYTGRPTVPVMVDLETNQVVNNDYFKLTNYLETAWKPFHKENAPDLYPEPLRAEIDALNDIIFHDINNGVYKCGFALSQEAYEEAYDRLFARLDELEERLSNQRFLFGNFITDSDIRLYSTLVRFDAAYYTAFNTNRTLIREFPNLWGYVRDLYQTPGFGDTTDFDSIKKHYHVSITIFVDKEDVKILPKGPDLSGWTKPHGREHLSPMKDKFLRHGGTTLHIRDAKSEELPYIRQQREIAYKEYAAVLPEQHWNALKQSILSESDAQAGVEVIVAEINGEIAGSVVLFPPKVKAYEALDEILEHAEIRMLAVAPSARGKGVASALVEECLSRTKRKGYNAIGLHTGEFMVQAMKLYEQFGFKRLPALDFEPANDGIIVKAYKLEW